MTIATIWTLVQKYDILRCTKPSMKVGGTFITLCVTGARIGHGNGLDLMLTRGGLLAISKITGNHSQAY